MVETNTTKEDFKEAIRCEREQLLSSTLGCTNTHIRITKYCEEKLNIKIVPGKAPDTAEFTAFLEYAATTKRMNELIIAYPDSDCLYKNFFHDIIQRIWGFLCRLNGAFQCRSILPSIAKKLLDFRDGKSIQYVEFVSVYDRLHSFAHFVRKELNGEKLHPGYLVTHDKSDIKISMRPSLDLLNKFMDSINDTSDSSVTGYASHGRVGSIEVATTPDEVLSFLDSARLDEDGELEMNLRDQMIFLNCPYMMRKMHEKLCR